MGKIRVLSDEVANQIAAGEVVERPASVVKELIENSLDSGATVLRVDTERGGRKLIRVTDNGSGMNRDDAMLAFERHATSKLSSAKELLEISTLGFRGEALPSIASVSRLTLQTKTEREISGTAVEFAGGRLLRCDEGGFPAGTAITVKDLFFNVPARKKFLRSDQTELAHIASLVTHYSLAHPEKDFLLTADGRDLLSARAVEDSRARVFQVFGSQTLRDLTEIDAVESVLEVQPPAPPPWARPEDYATPDPEQKTFRLSGFVSGPHVQKPNRNSIFLFVNKRLIKDRLLLHALSAAYHSLIPPKSFPFALLFLECPFDEVDVNVHPSKTEVRFRHQSFVHDFLRDTVAEVLSANRPASALPGHAASPMPQPAAGMPYSEFTQRLENLEPDAPPSMVMERGQPVAPGEEHQNLGERAAEYPEFTLKPPVSPAPKFDFSGSGIRVEQAPRPAPAFGKLPVPDTHRAFPPGLAVEPVAGLHGLAELRPLGQIHDSFIVAVGPDGLWIIDQHVAHERILFEQVLRQRIAGQVEKQALLLPIVLDLTPAQRVQYERIVEELAKTGFETELLGQRSISVTAAPAGAQSGEVEKILFEILEIIESEYRTFSLDDVQRAVSATIACRSAIKINTPLDPAKMEWMLRALAATENPMTCPHGRPIALRYSTREILRSFHRI